MTCLSYLTVLGVEIGHIVDILRKPLSIGLISSQNVEENAYCQLFGLTPPPPPGGFGEVKVVPLT